MILNFFKRRKILKQTNTLDLIPIKIVEHEIADNGKTKLIVPRFKNKILSNTFTGSRISSNFKISLDDKGSKTWELIDNKKNISDIAKILNVDNNNENSEDQLSLFFIKLYNEGFITFRQLLDTKS